MTASTSRTSRGYIDFGQYIGLPYLEKGRGRDGIDCWGLVILILREQLGIELPSYEDVPEFDGAEHVEPLSEHHKDWTRCEPPFRRWDVLMFKLGRHLHVGLMIDETQFIGALGRVGSCTQPASRSVWERSRIGAYRHFSQL